MPNTKYIDTNGALALVGCTRFQLQGQVGRRVSPPKVVGRRAYWLRDEIEKLKPLYAAQRADLKEVLGD